MARKVFLVFCSAIVNYQLAASQYTGSQLINRPVEFVEQIVANPCQSFTPQLPIPTIISDPPCNNLIPITSPSTSNTILITDCSPASCQNLADTLQLMIVCNLLQNTPGGKNLALQLAGPVINQLISSPALTCGCPNPVFNPNLAPSVISPTLAPVNSPCPNKLAVVNSPCPNNLAVVNSPCPNNLAAINPPCPNNLANAIPVLNQIQNGPCNCGCASNPLIQGLLNYV